MNISAFDVIGPAMVGPSSSHTAGAVRLGLLSHYIARGIGPFARVKIELHGSFAATGKGHATDRGLVAGILGLLPDDERLKNSFQIAHNRGIGIHFQNTDLGSDAHPNSVRITFYFAGGETLVIYGASVGGGNVEIRKIDGFETRLSGTLDSILCWHLDRPGFLARVTGLLSCVEANIATIITARKMRETDAFTIIKTDSPIPDDCLSVLLRIPFVKRGVRIPKIC